MTTYFVYILRCADGTLYTGITTDIGRRVQEHNRGTASKYTRARLPVTLVYQEFAESRSAATKREIMIKKLSKARKLCLFVSALCLAICVFACVPHRTPSTAYLATKAPYPTLENDHRYEAPPENCEPVHVEGLFRHGSRYLADSRKIKKLARVMKRKKAKGRSTKTEDEWLDKIDKVLSSFREGQLTRQGRMEQFQLGQRFGQRFEALLQRNNRVELVSAFKERVKESREHFRSGLSSYMPIQAKMTDGNLRVLRYFDYCKSYLNHKTSLVETGRNKNKRPTRVMNGLYALCQLEYNLAQETAEDGFCSLLSADQKANAFKKYNTEAFYRIGPAAHSGMACAVMEPMFDRMQKIVQGESLAAADLAFVHAETVVPVASFLELFEPDPAEWKASDVGPMAVNLQLVTYACTRESKRSYKLKLLYNEKERNFNIPECQSSFYCDFELVKGYYERRKQELGMKSCSPSDFEEHCNV